MKRTRALAAAAALAITAASVTGCATEEMLRVRTMSISHIDMSRVRDGTYAGDYTYGGYTYVVEVSVQGGRVTGIRPTANRNTEPARNAEGVIPRIIEEQRNDVDVVSGATTTSKALLKAIETALEKGL